MISVAVRTFPIGIESNYKNPHFVIVVIVIVIMISSYNDMIV